MRIDQAPKPLCPEVRHGVEFLRKAKWKSVPKDEDLICTAEIQRNGAAEYCGLKGKFLALAGIPGVHVVVCITHYRLICQLRTPA